MSPLLAKALLVNLNGAGGLLARAGGALVAAGAAWVVGGGVVGAGEGGKPYRESAGEPASETLGEVAATGCWEGDEQPLRASAPVTSPASQALIRVGRFGRRMHIGLFFTDP